MTLKHGFEFIDKIEELSAMPSIALDLMSMLNDPTSSVKTIVEKIRLDPAMITYTLKSCNSPLYGVRNEVSSVPMAINLLGFVNLKSILMSYFMRNLYQLSGKNEIKNYLWKHSISVAVFSKTLAPHTSCDPEEGYLAGLLHDIGKMVLYLHNPKDYEKVIEKVENESEEFVEAEEELFQFTHADAGHYLLEKWKFTDTLKNTVLYHHEDQHIEGPEKLIPLVAFADQLAHIYLEDRNGETERYIKKFNLSQAQLDKIIEQSLQTIDTYHSLA